MNCLIEEVDRDTHQFQHPDQLTKILLDIIEENYLYKVEHQCCPLSNIFEIISYEYQLQYSMYIPFCVRNIYFFEISILSLSLVAVLLYMDVNDHGLELRTLQSVWFYQV